MKCDWVGCALSSSTGWGRYGQKSCDRDHMRESAWGIVGQNRIRSMNVELLIQCRDVQFLGECEHEAETRVRGERGKIQRMHGRLLPHRQPCFPQ